MFHRDDVEEAFEFATAIILPSYVIWRFVCIVWHICLIVL